MTILSDLAAEALRKVGLSPYPVEARPLPGVTIDIEDLIDQTMRMVGVAPVAPSERPGPGATVSVKLIAEMALRMLARNPIPQDVVPPLNGDETDLTDIATRALRRLGVVAATQPPDADDLDVAGLIATDVLTELHSLNAATWAFDQVPVWTIEHMVGMVCHYLAPHFGMPADPEGYARARDALIAGQLAGVRGQDMAEDAVNQAHQTLNSMGLLTYAATAIPEACAQHYAVMAAAKLAPVYGIPADEAAYQAAIGQIRIFAMSSANIRQWSIVPAVFSVHHILADLGYVTWEHTAIPESAAPHYVIMASQLVGPVWGRPMDHATYNAAVNAMRLLCMSGPVGQGIAEAKVWAAHRSLEARGLTRWTLWDLPPYAREPYVWITAEMLAPEVGQPPMPGLMAAGEREIRRMIALPSTRQAVRAVYL